MFGKAQTKNRTFEERLSIIASGSLGTMRRQVSASPEGGAQLRLREPSKRLSIWKLLAAVFVGGVAMTISRAGFLRFEPFLDADRPIISWSLLLLGDLGLAVVIGVLAMIALKLNKPALQGSLAAGIAAMFVGDIHVAATFPDAFAAIYTEDYVMRATLVQGSTLQAFLR